MTIGGLTWDTQSKHYYYTGIDGVALYVFNDATSWYGAPVAWNGVTAVNESPSGAESNKLYADNIEYLNLLSKEEFGCTLECYQTPYEFLPCDGCGVLVANSTTGKPILVVRGRPRKSFGLVYRVRKGTDTVEAGGKIEGSSYGNGYVYHVVYGCKASPSSRDFATVNDSPEAQTFSYEINTIAITDTSRFPAGSGWKEVAHLEIDCSKLLAGKQTALENLLYNAEGTMPTPAQIATAIN
jgi:hypothetical protein